MQFPESWLREFCHPDLNTAQLAELLTMSGLEVEDTQPYLTAQDTDVLFTLKLTPNLGRALSVYGVAREVAALTGAALKEPLCPGIAPISQAHLPVHFDPQTSRLGGRFSGRVVQGLDAHVQTPSWIVERLKRCGQRSVNVLADISNYVMFEMGQPSHIFDLDQITGPLTVRWGHPGESLKLLNHQVVEIDEHVGVIADQQGVQSLAGLMGGHSTATTDQTQNIYIEAAFWWPEAIAGRARRFNLSTEAGHRYERGVDPARTAACVERITQLVIDICGGQAGPLQDHILETPEPRPVTLRIDRASKVIGMPVTRFECENVMSRLGLPYVVSTPDQLEVTPPTWRFDLSLEEDLIEEVIRVLGYDKLPDELPSAKIFPVARRETMRSVHALRHQLVNLGYQETINFSFVEKKLEEDLTNNESPIALLNPISASLSVMRSSLLGSLLQVLQKNLSHRAEMEAIRLFEIARVYEKRSESPDQTDTGIQQPLKIAGLAWGQAHVLQWGCKDRSVDYFDVKGDVEALLRGVSPRFSPVSHPAFHPGRSAQIEVGGRVAGFLGELHPRWRQAYELPSAPVLFEVEAEVAGSTVVSLMQAISRQPSVTRDLGLMVEDKISHDFLVAEIYKASIDNLVKNVRLFDIYQLPSSKKDASSQMAQSPKSMTFRLELRDDFATLTEEKIEKTMSLIVQHLTRLGIRLRTA